MQNQEEQEIEIDLREIAGLLINRLWVLILSGILLGLCVGMYTRASYVPMYTSTAKLYIVGSTGIDLSNLSSFQIGTQLTMDYIEFIQSRPLLEDVIDELELDMNYEQLLNLVKVETPENTRILKLTVTLPDRKETKEIVNKVAEIAQTRIAEITKMDQPSIYEYGVNGTLSARSHFTRNTMLGFIAGAVLAAFVIVVIHMMDDTIKTSEDLEKYLGLITLGTIPLAEEPDNKNKNKGLPKKPDRKAVKSERKIS